MLGLLCYRRGFSSGRNWLLFYMFSRHYGLDDSMEFLADCAMRQDWLTLVVFAELFQCSPSKVKVLSLSFLFLSLQSSAVEQVLDIPMDILSWEIAEVVSPCLPRGL